MVWAVRNTQTAVEEKGFKNLPSRCPMGSSAFRSSGNSSPPPGSKISLSSPRRRENKVDGAQGRRRVHGEAKRLSVFTGPHQVARREASSKYEKIHVTPEGREKGVHRRNNKRRFHQKKVWEP